MFAGPNGSGKSTLFEAFEEQYDPGIYVNSDEIEKNIFTHGFINLEYYGLSLTQEDWDAFLQTKNAQSLLANSQSKGHLIEICIKENVIIDQSVNSHSYEASLIASFIRQKLIETQQSFSFETVMVHVSKLEDMASAKEHGYKTYFYFICLDDPELNVSRVQDRVQKGGHPVDPETVARRYPQTLNNLLPAIKLADKSYLFDNSDSMRLIAEVNDNQLTLLCDEDALPNWFINFVINKL
jgi:predicted ABC-type ATPase